MERNDNMNGKIVQIMKCEEDFKAVYVEDDEKLYSHPVIAWGLTEDGEVVPLTVELSEGVLKDARNECYIGLLSNDYILHGKQLDNKEELIATMTLHKMCEVMSKQRKSHQISCNLSNGNR